MGAAFLCAALQTACPAYLVSGIGTDRGRQRAAVAPEEKDAKLRCQGKDCAAVDVSRGFTVSRNPGAYWVVLGTEALGSGVALSDWLKSNGKTDGSVSGVTKTKQYLLLGATLAAAGLAISDVIFGDRQPGGEIGRAHV